jgi:hypothetical protein
MKQKFFILFLIILYISFTTCLKQSNLEKLKDSFTKVNEQIDSLEKIIDEKTLKLKSQSQLEKKLPFRPFVPNSAKSVYQNINDYLNITIVLPNLPGLGVSAFWPTNFFDSQGWINYAIFVVIMFIIPFIVCCCVICCMTCYFCIRL